VEIEETLVPTTPEGGAVPLSDVELIRALLADLGLSQREAARKLGVDERAMRYFCAGKEPVPPAVMLALQQLRAAASPEAPPLLVVHPALQAACEKADRNPQPLDELDLAGHLHHVLAGLGRDLEPLERRGAYAVVGALNFVSRRFYGPAVWNMHWQPLSSWTDDQKRVHHIPDINLADDDTIREWARRARTSLHPVLRARYGDLAWEVARFRKAAARDKPDAAPTIRPDPENASVAIDAYLEAVARRLAHDVFDAWRYLGRAVELAVSIRDDEQLLGAKAAAFAYREACENVDPTYPFWLFDNIVWEQRKVLELTDEEKATEIAALERVLALRADASDPQRFDPHSAQDAADRLGRWRRHLGEEAEARRAANTAGLAMETAAEQVPALSGIAILEGQIARYRNAGDEAGAARVEEAIRRRAPAAKGELRHMETRYEIPKDELDAWADHVAGATFEEGLQRLVAANLIRKGQSEAAVRELAEAAPLQAHIPIQVMRDDGFSTAAIGSVEKDLDGRAIHHAANLLAATAPFLNVSLARFREKHAVDLGRLMSWLVPAPLFPDSRLKLVRDGLAAWFAEDWVKAIHVLLPQTEAALRDLLAKFGGTVMRPDPDRGGFQAIGLGAVCGDELFRANVPEDVRFHLKVLMYDPRGINLRNEFAHGMAARELFDRGIANWVVHLVIMLGCIRLQPTAAAAPDGAPQA
jgi:transcriptional regulator with XRE-family HTH domain